MNQNITWVEINRHPEIPWDFGSIAYNTMSSPADIKRWKSVYDEILKEIKYIIV